MKKRLFICLLALILLVCTACAGAENVTLPGNPSNDTRWEVLTIVGDAVTLTQEDSGENTLCTAEPVKPGVTLVQFMAYTSARTWGPVNVLFCRFDVDEDLQVSATIINTKSYEAPADNAALPPYDYMGDDPIMAAVCDYIVAHEQGWTRNGPSVTIPAPIILRVDQPDPDHAIVYGNFWCLNYSAVDCLLVTVSGGENPGVMKLAYTDGVWAVTEVSFADYGEEFYPSIVRLANGDQALVAAYLGTENQLDSVKLPFIRDYVQGNGLPFLAVYDFFWPAIPLFTD